MLAALQTIAAHGTTSRAAIARATGLTRATVSSLVAQLIEEGLVRELGPAEAGTAGKPPSLLTIDDDGRQMIALDLSRQPFEGRVMSLGGETLHRTRADRPATGTNAVEAVVELVAQCLANTSSPVLGIGVGTPGMISPDGAVRVASHLEWHDVPLRQVLADRFELPVAVGNDAHVSALAQLRASQADTLLLVTVGEGIGSGLILNGSLHTGDHLASGEIGHVVVDPGGQACHCGLHGCLETVAALPAVERGPNGFTADSAHRAARHLGATLAVVVAAVDLELVVVSSPLTQVDGYIESVQRELRSRLHPDRAGEVTVEASRIEDIVLAGAAAAAMREVLGVVLR